MDLVFDTPFCNIRCLKMVAPGQILSNFSKILIVPIVLRRKPTGRVTFIEVMNNCKFSAGFENTSIFFMCL